MTILKRASKITFDILEGADVLAEGHEIARHLWNHLWWCQIGYNRKLVKQRQGYIGFFSDRDKKWVYRGLDWDVIKPNLPHKRGHKYLGKYKLDKEMRTGWCSDTCKICWKKLSDRCFSYIIKNFDIAMRSWFSNLKTNPKARPPSYSNKPGILNFEVGRQTKPIGNMLYRLTVHGRHVERRYATIKLKIKPGIRMKDISLLRLNSDGTGVVVINVEIADELSGIRTAAIDLGIRNLAMIAFDDGQSIMVSGAELKANDQWYHKRASKCKPSNWSKGKAESKQSQRNVSYRRKAGNVRRLMIHNLTAFIINQCLSRGVGIIVTGDLKGLRDGVNHGKRNNQFLHAWPFAEIVRQLQYKGEEVGIKVFQVNERGTSSHCHFCNQKGIRKPTGLFTCKGCQMVINSDVNGAFNILNRLHPLLVSKMEELEVSISTLKDKLLVIESNEKKFKQLKGEMEGKINLLANLLKVSPSLVCAGVGVEAVFPGLPSPNYNLEIRVQDKNDQGIGVGFETTKKVKIGYSQIHPTFVAKFDLRDWSLSQLIAT
jgi:IS605 OrfB family transposase